MRKDSLPNEKLHLLFKKCIAQGFPFAIYRLPKKEEIQFVIQNSAQEIFIESLEEIKDLSGFIVAPFHSDNENKCFFIRPDFTDFTFLEEKFEVNQLNKIKDREVAIVNQDAFQIYVEHAKKKIEVKQLEKVVTARAIKHSKSTKFNDIDFFLRVCKSYKWSFVSLVYIPSKGLWMGASPELLLYFSNDIFTTFSLAGTQPIIEKQTNSTIWGEKEIAEQEIVTKYIQNIAEKMPHSEIKVEGPITKNAGNVQHLLTTFSIKGASHANWCKLASTLHPTPAVSGFPKSDAIQFIIENEKKNRSFYSGFLGPVNMNGEINLYVNLRCMEIQEKHLILHVGCGITHDSDSLKEWEETELKSKTLLDLIE